MDYKAVANMTDSDFMGHLGWTERSSHSPLIKKQYKTFPKSNGYVPKTPNPYGQ